MPTCRSLAWLLVLLGVSTAAPCDDRSVAEEVPSRPPHVRALDAAYRQQVTDAHADSDQVREVLAAAMLATLEPLRQRLDRAEAGTETGGHAVVQPWLERAERLYARALELAGDDIPALWAIAHIDHRHPGLQALAVRALERLEALDADNAALWIEQLQRRQDSLEADAPAAREALLARAADATHHALHVTKMPRMLVAAFGAVAMPRGLGEALAAEVGNDDPDAAHLVHALGVVMAIALPSHRVLFEACDEAGVQDQRRRARCLAIGRLMAETGDTPLAESIGLEVWEKAALAPAERKAQAEAKRRARWRNEAFLELLQGADGLDWKRFGPLWLTPGVSEVELQRRALREAGISLVPPADFIIEAR